LCLDGRAYSFQTQPQRRRVAFQRKLDDLLDEPGSMRFEQLSELDSAILDTARAAGGVPGDSFLKRHRLLWL
jgi:hypothetical protein